MKIAEFQLRNIIKQVMSEMAWAGSLGDQTGEEEEKSRSSVNTDKPNWKGAKTYSKSKKFAELAKKYYANIPFAVWTAPYIGPTGVGSSFHKKYGIASDLEDGTGRAARLIIKDLSNDGLNLLNKIGYNTEKINTNNDLVILYSNIGTDVTFLATPWIIFHSIFDSSTDTKNISPTFSELFDSLYMGEGEFSELFYLDSFEWSSALTMKSAREGLELITSDALAEIMTQELLTKGGFRYNEDALNLQNGDVNEVELFKKLKILIKQAADEFRQNSKGKLLIVTIN